MALSRTTIMLGEFLPDRRQLNNEGLLRAWGVVPLSGNYIRAPHVDYVDASPGAFTGPLPPPLVNCSNANPPLGFYAHDATRGYFGTETALVEILLTTAAETVRTRTVGGAYGFATSPPASTEFWWFTSFGSHVIATNLEDAVQFLDVPGAGNFEALITSTFAPRAKIAFPIRGNMFLAHLDLDAVYDGLPIGLHPQLVAWSQSNNVRAYGSITVDPALVGAGYQELDNDLGAIRAGIGGDFGILFQDGGITRIDGPPYEFRTIVVGDSTIYPYSVVRLGDDVYFWGRGGPSVLRGGEAPVVRLGLGKLQRSLLDHKTGFGDDFARAANLPVREVSTAVDSANELVRFCYRPHTGALAVLLGGGASGGVVGTVPTIFLDYNIQEERFGLSRSAAISFAPQIQATRDLFLRAAPPTEDDSWGPFGRVFALQVAESPSASASLIRYELNGSYTSSFPDLVLQTGYGRLHATETTRIVAVRPMWTGTPASLPSISAGVSVVVGSKNHPYAAPTETAPATMIAADGWMPTPGSIYGSYHAVTVRFGGEEADEAEEIHEIEAVEIQFEVGGTYGA